MWRLRFPLKTPKSQKNAEEAAKWWRKAADQGHAEAQFQLGCLYYQGEGVNVDRVEAVKLWRKAAAQGHADALCNLGVFHYYGFCVPRDRLEGLRLLRRAKENGSSKADDLLFQLYWNNR